MKKNNKINEEAVRETLSDYAALTESLDKNTTESVIKSVIKENISEKIDKFLAEEEEKDYEEKSEDTAENEDETKEEEVSETENDETKEGEDFDFTEDSEETESTENAEEGETEEKSEEDEWTDFDDYKISDEEGYDFTNAEDDDVVRVFKLLKGDEEIAVEKDNDGNINIKDNETGNEYIVQLDGDGDIDGCEDGECEFLLDSEDDEEDPMSEGIEYVIEQDDKQEFTDNYQDKTAMTTLPNKEVGKGRNWDKGVPYGDEKRFSKLKAKQTPFTEEPMEEAAKTVARANRRKATKSKVTNPDYEQTPKQYGYKKYSETDKNEYFAESVKKMNKILDENKKLKKALSVFKTKLAEAAVTNVNLGQIIKLMMENSTSKEEKKDIINRFANEAKTIKESNALYESISRELSKKTKVNESKVMNENIITEDTKAKKEIEIYESKELQNIRDLMERVNKY